MSSLRPKPVITTRGLCFAINAKGMEDVFKESQYTNNFKEEFVDNTGQDEKIKNGLIESQIKINLHLQYLTDRAATTGTIW